MKNFPFLFVFVLASILFLASDGESNNRFTKYKISSSSGAFSTSSATYVDVTNLSVSLKTTGRPVHCFLQPDGSNLSYLGTSSSGATTSTQGLIQILRDATVLGEWTFRVGGASSSSVGGGFPSGAIQFLDTPTAGTYTYKIQAEIGTGTDAVVGYSKLACYELP